MKEIFKKWKAKSLLGLDSSEDIPNFTNHEITEINMKCDIYITEMWNDMWKKPAIEITKYSREVPKQNW